MKTMTPTRIRSMEFVEGALAQADPARVARLVGRALEADPSNPVAVALLGHLETATGRALPLYVRALRGDVARGEGVGGCVLDLAEAALAFAGCDPHAAVAVLSPRLGATGSRVLDAAVARLLAGAAFACGDAEAGMRAAAACGEVERAWFGFLAAARYGERAAPALGLAIAAAPRLADPVLTGGGADEEPANPACLFPAGDGLAVARAAVLPGLAASPAAVALLAAAA